MGGLSGACLLLLATAAVALDDNRWVWGGTSRNAGYPSEILESRPQPSYRPPAPVIEGTDFIQPTYTPSRPPPGFRPGRPGFGPGPGPGPSVRPPLPPPSPGPSGPSGPGILTGPVPSWEQGREDPTAYKHYDRCRCTQSFNCPSPGLKFGTCDEGKQYCCFSTKADKSYQHQPSGLGTRPGPPGRPDFDRPPPGRPGRPGRLDRPDRPVPFDRPVLVGPGGPTGIIVDPERPYGKPYGQGYARPRPPYDRRPIPFDPYEEDEFVRSNKSKD